MTVEFFSGQVRGLRGPSMSQADSDRLENAVQSAAKVDGLSSYGRATYTVETGYFDYSGTAKAYAPARRAKFAVTPGQVLRISTTVSGGDLGVYGFYTSADAYLGDHLPQSGTSTYTELLVTVPSGVAEMHVNGFRGTAFLIERRLDPSSERLEAAAEAQRVWKRVGVTVPGFARAYDGQIVVAAGTETIVFAHEGPAKFRHTSRVQGAAGTSAARVYMDDAGQWFGSEGPSTPTPVFYENAEFETVGGIATVLISGTTSSGDALILEQLVESETFGTDLQAASDALTTTLTGPTPITLSLVSGFWNLNTHAVDTSVTYSATANIPAQGGDQFRVQVLNGGGGTAAVVYLDAAGHEVSYVARGPDVDTQFDQKVTVPLGMGIASMQVTGKSFAPILVDQIEFQESIAARIARAEQNIAPLSHWQGKNLLWLGTSIPEVGYPQIVGKRLSANVTNVALGSSSARFGVSARRSPSDPYGLTGLPWDVVFRALAKTIAECEWLITNWSTIRPLLINNSDGPPPTTLSDADKAMIRGSTWERRMAPSLGASLALICWDHGRNDWSQNPTGTDIGAATGGIGDMRYLPSDAYPTAYPDPLTGAGAGADRTRDRGTFLGAMNYLRDKAQAANNFQRHVVIGHFETDRGTLNISQGQESLSLLWGVPIIRTWQLAGMSQQTIRNSDGTVVLRDGTPLTQSRVLMADNLHPRADPFFTTLVDIYDAQLRAIR